MCCWILLDFKRPGTEFSQSVTGSVTSLHAMYRRRYWPVPERTPRATHQPTELKWSIQRRLSVRQSAQPVGPSSQTNMHNRCPSTSRAGAPVSPVPIARYATLYTTRWKPRPRPQRRLSTVKRKGSPYSITERRDPELIPVLGSQPAGDVSHKPGGRLPLLSARPAVTPATLKRAATNCAVWWTEERWVWTVCLSAQHSGRLIHGGADPGQLPPPYASALVIQGAKI